MGRIDARTKEYMKNPSNFAALFNFLMYDGKPVIDPEKLTRLDTAEGTIIDQNGLKVPVQKYRDSLEAWSIMEDDNLVYVLLAEEFQSEVHYAGPVKDMIYDSINYVDQVNEIKRKYMKTNAQSEISFENDGVKIHMTRAEFLSGLRKGDKLKPVVTLMIYLGTEEWDGPRTLHDMLYFPDERIKAFVPDYKLNLIVPRELKDEDFPKFGTNVGSLLWILNRGKAGVADLLNDPQFRSIDGETACLANDLAGLNLNIVIDEGGKANMCKAMEDHDIQTGIKFARDFFGDNDEKIIQYVAHILSADPEYVRNIMVHDDVSTEATAS
ncbi:MAG: transposase [Clostridia bacterium]|nr:transposase [Clostridia bacterium]